MTTVALDKPYHKKPLNRDWCNHKGSCTLLQTIINHRSRGQLLQFRPSFYQKISCEFLVQGNFKYTHYLREYWHWRNSKSQPQAPKASAVSIELIWLQKLNDCFQFTSNDRSIYLRQECQDFRACPVVGCQHHFTSAFLLRRILKQSL